MGFSLNLSPPGPGTAALIGTALILAALALNSKQLSQLIIYLVVIAAYILLVTGVWIEYKSFKERKAQKELYPTTS